MDLREMLAQRELIALLMTAERSGISFEGILTKRETKQLFSQGGTDWYDRLRYYYRFAGNEEELFDRETLEEARTNKRLAAAVNKQKNIIHALEKADRQKDVIAQRTADQLLDRNRAETFLKHWILYACRLPELLGKSVSEDPGEIIGLPLDLTYFAEVLRRTGYAEAEFTDAYHNEDGHRHCVSLKVPAQVLALFNSICTPEYVMKARIARAVSGSCNFAKEYYWAAPLETGMKLYRILSDGELPELSEEEYLRIAEENSDYCYGIRLEEGRYYITEYNICEEDEELLEEELDVLMYSISRARDCSDDYYIPSREEMKEFIENSWWPSRRPYQQLRQFLEEYYLDEQTMNLMGSRMFTTMLSLPEEKTLSDYDMDRVEEEVQETMFEITDTLMCGNSVADVERMQDTIFMSIHDEAKAKLRDILEQCRRETNQRNDLGYAGRDTEE